MWFPVESSKLFATLPLHAQLPNSVAVHVPSWSTSTLRNIFTAFSSSSSCYKSVSWNPLTAYFSLTSNVSDNRELRYCLRKFRNDCHNVKFWLSICYVCSILTLFECWWQNIIRFEHDIWSELSNWVELTSTNCLVECVSANIAFVGYFESAELSWSADLLQNFF